MNNVSIVADNSRNPDRIASGGPDKQRQTGVDKMSTIADEHAGSDGTAIPLEAMAAHLVDRFAKVAIDNIRARYELGQLVANTRYDRGCAKGTTGLDRLSNALDVHSTALRRCARVCTTFTRDELEAMLSLRRPNGLPVTWSHLELVSEVTSRHTRWILVQRAVAEGLSVRELAALIRDTRQSRRTTPRQTVSKSVLG
ncbi:hypothetical protein [Pendulispora albinea]|uniref:Uncharacterized protein n=1 Tax=Pendulispora albinea TaxID=2741071 RepID=A0ABZ2LZK7_9BACT